MNSTPRYQGYEHANNYSASEDTYSIAKTGGWPLWNPIPTSPRLQKLSPMRSEPKSKSKSDAKTDAKDDSKIQAKPEPAPKVEAEAKPEAIAKTPADLTPQLVKRVHELFEQPWREEVRAVEELEKAERENRKVESNK